MIRVTFKEAYSRFLGKGDTDWYRLVANTTYKQTKDPISVG